MATDLSRMRVGEKLRVDSGARKQDGRPAYIGASSWSIDAATPAVAGDPTTVHTIATSSVATPTVITTTTAHGLITNDRVVISGHSGSTPTINSDWRVIRLSATTFSLYAAFPPASPLAVSVGGTGGTVKRQNALLELRDDGAPPRGYDIDLTGQTSGDGLLRLLADPNLPNGAQVLDSKAFTILNASSFHFTSSPQNYINASGVLILDLNDAAGPNNGNPITITALPIDARGVPTEEPFVEYVVHSWAWSDPAAHLSLSPSSGSVDVSINSVGDGVLTLTALNTAGNVVTASLAYQVLGLSVLGLASI